VSSTTGVARSIAFFTIAQALLIALAALVLMKFVWTDAPSAHAIQVSAWLAVVVQVITFAMARLVAQQNVIAGWGVGVLLRFAVVAFWAFLGASSLGLVETPALMSLVTFFFVSTLIEPVFLNI
jgi:hypothetical protein